MRQRLGIARALVNDPQVVFFDEPTLGLDPAGQEQVLLLVRSIAARARRDRRTSTHFLGEVEDVCSRVLILNRGRVVADGTVAEVTRQAAAPRARPVPRAGRAARAALVALATCRGIGEVRADEGGPTWSSSTPPTRRADEVQVGERCGARSRACPLLAFELEGARLSDAFLSMTEEG